MSGGFCGNRTRGKSSTQLEPKCLRSCLRQEESKKDGTVQVIASTELTGDSERFSGAGANGSDLKRWKLWCLAKMNTMTSLPTEARGPFVYTMLDRDALAEVESLEFLEWAVEGCENLIFTILENRFPGEDSVDETDKS